MSCTKIGDISKTTQKQPEKREHLQVETRIHFKQECSSTDSLKTEVITDTKESELSLKIED